MTTKAPRHDDWRARLRLALWATFAIAFVAFVLDNTHRVVVGLVATDRKIPLIWALLLAAALGALLVALLQRRTR